MTRINSAVLEQLLTDEHLRAEHRECKRLPKSFLKRKSSKIGLKFLPDKFTFGKGHVLFFVDKGGFTLKRYRRLYKECLIRGFNVTDFSSSWKVYGKRLKDYTPTLEEYELQIERISTRIRESSLEYFHYYGERVTKEYAIDLLRGNHLIREDFLSQGSLPNN